MTPSLLPTLLLITPHQHDYPTAANTGADVNVPAAAPTMTIA